MKNVMSNFGAPKTSSSHEITNKAKESAASLTRKSDFTRQKNTAQSNRGQNVNGKAVWWEKRDENNANLIKSYANDQECLNDFVLSVPIKRLTEDSKCNFSLAEKLDKVTDKHKIGAVHNCEKYGLNLTMYLYTEDLNNRIAEEFKVTDSFGNEVAGN